MSLLRLLIGYSFDETALAIQVPTTKDTPDAKITSSSLEKNKLLNVHVTIKRNRGMI